MGTQSRHRSQGPGGYRSHRGAARHRGLPVRLHQPRSRGNVSRLTDYVLVCDIFPSVTCIAIAYVLGMGLVGYEKFVFSAPNPNNNIKRVFALLKKTKVKVFKQNSYR